MTDRRGWRSHWRIVLLPITSSVNNRATQFILRTPPGQPAYLVAAHVGFEVNAVNCRNPDVPRLNGVSLRRLADRRPGAPGLASFDQFRRAGRLRRTFQADGIDEFNLAARSVRPRRTGIRPELPTIGPDVIIL